MDITSFLCTQVSPAGNWGGGVCNAGSFSGEGHCVSSSRYPFSNYVLCHLLHAIVYLCMGLGGAYILWSQTHFSPPALLIMSTLD